MQESSPIITSFTKPAIILSVSPIEGDHGALEEIFRQESKSGNETKWKLVSTPTLEWALSIVRRNQISIALCEQELQPGTWKELLEQTAILPHAPVVIVTSRLADERMWAEALNLGAWDVLAKPFDPAEVIQVIESAWRHWQDKHQSPAKDSSSVEGGGLKVAVAFKRRLCTSSGA